MIQRIFMVTVQDITHKNPNCAGNTIGVYKHRFSLIALVFDHLVDHQSMLRHLRRAVMFVEKGLKTTISGSRGPPTVTTHEWTEAGVVHFQCLHQP